MSYNYNYDGGVSYEIFEPGNRVAGSTSTPALNGEISSMDNYQDEQLSSRISDEILFGKDTLQHIYSELDLNPSIHIKDEPMLEDCLFGASRPVEKVPPTIPSSTFEPSPTTSINPIYMSSTIQTEPLNVSDFDFLAHTLENDEFCDMYGNIQPIENNTKTVASGIEEKPVVSPPIDSSSSNVASSTDDEYSMMKKKPKRKRVSIYRGVTKTSKFKWGAKYKSTRITSTCTTEKDAALIYDSFIRDNFPKMEDKCCNFCKDCGKFRNPLKLSEVVKECNCQVMNHKDLTTRNIFEKKVVPSPKDLHSGEVVVSIDSIFWQAYWRNGRKNLQCFPTCPEFGDFFHVKTNNLTHSKPGVCVSPIEVTMRVHADTDLESVVVLGKFTKLGMNGEGIDVIPENFSAMELLKFQNDYYLADEVVDKRISESYGYRTSWKFQPRLWKFEEELKKKRKATRNSPGRTMYYAFMVLVIKWDYQAGVHMPIQKVYSTPFEILSTKTIQRSVAKTERMLDACADYSNAPDISNNNDETVELKLPPTKRRATDIALMPNNGPDMSDPIKSEPTAVAETAQVAISNYDVAVAYEDLEESRLKSNPPLELETDLKRQARSPRVEIAPPIPINRDTIDLIQGSRNNGVQEQFEGSQLRAGVVVQPPNDLPFQKDKNLTDAYLCAIPFGFIGLHHFYLDRPKWGILYACTFGLLGSGVLFDAIFMDRLLRRVNNQEKYLDKIECYTLLIPFGLLGFHQFYLRRYWVGVFYALTFGVFGLGLVIDLFRIPSLIRKANYEIYGVVTDENDTNNVVNIEADDAYADNAYREYPAHI